MMKLMRKQLSNQRGVTLIELLAVIVILGILAAVAVPAVLNQIDDAGDKADTANIALVNDAIERYAVMNGEYPSVTARTNTVSDLIDELNDGEGAPYIKDFPAKKADGTTDWKLKFEDGVSGTSTVVVGIE